MVPSDTVAVVVPDAIAVVVPDAAGVVGAVGRSRFALETEDELESDEVDGARTGCLVLFRGFLRWFLKQAGWREEGGEDRRKGGKEGCVSVCVWESAGALWRRSHAVFRVQASQLELHRPFRQRLTKTSNLA